MNIFYKRILNLTVGHSYFKDGADRFVTLHTTAATDELLRNGKMLFKRLPNGVTILYRTLDDESTPFVELEKNQRFTFVLKSANINGFLNITDLDESLSKTFSTGNVVYYTNNPANVSINRNNPEILTHEIIDSLRGPLFTYQFTLNGNPATVRMIVTDAEGNPVSVGKDTNGNSFPTNLLLTISNNNSFNQQIDLRDLPRGKYLMTIRNEANTVTLKSEKIYVDEQLERDNILGIVDIVYDSVTGHLYGNTEEYKLQFQGAKTFWKYYIVNKSKNIDLATDSLLINDSGTVNGSPYQINSFQRVYAGIQLTAKTSGVSGNSVTLAYSGGGIYPAIVFSGETLSGGTAGISAKGTLTIIINETSGYTINIGGVDFTEGTHFTKGANAAATAAALIAAINGNGIVPVTASALEYDIIMNDLKTLVFASTGQIPFFEIPKLKLELRKTSDNQTIVANLPNPSHSGLKKLFAGRVESEVYVFI
jgi:hypothetical protein